MTPPIRPFEIDPEQPGRPEIQEVPPDLPEVVLAEAEAALPPAEPTSRWRRWFVASAAIALVVALVVQAVTWTRDLVIEQPLLGLPMAILLGIVATTAFGLFASEVRDFRKLQKRAHLRAAAERLVGSELHGQADAVLLPITNSFLAKPQFQAGVESYHAAASDVLTDGERLLLLERHVLAPADRAAYRLVIESSRDVGILTALSPLGLLDGVLVLWRTMIMMRQVARLYGMAPGPIASLALLKRCLRNAALAGLADVVAHATIEHVGASLLTLLSARAGQGAGNALLGARLGIEAMRQTRPLPFIAEPPPSLREIRRRLLEAPPGAKP